MQSRFMVNGIKLTLNFTIMKNVQKITQLELINILGQINKGTFVNLFILTKVRMNKKNNPYWEQIFKLNSFNAIIGNSYEIRLFNETNKAGIETPEIQENKVGNHVSKVVLFNEKLQTFYLQYEIPKNYKAKALYFFQNSIILKEKFKEFMPTVKPNENKPTFVTVKIENIKSITINKIKYLVE